MDTYETVCEGTKILYEEKFDDHTISLYHYLSAREKDERYFEFNNFPFSKKALELLDYCNVIKQEENNIFIRDYSDWHFHHPFRDCETFEEEMQYAESLQQEYIALEEEIILPPTLIINGKTYKLVT